MRLGRGLRLSRSRCRLGVRRRRGSVLDPMVVYKMVERGRRNRRYLSLVVEN